jgi:hypothetical protein
MGFRRVADSVEKEREPQSPISRKAVELGPAAATNHACRENIKRQQNALGAYSHDTPPGL